MPVAGLALDYMGKASVTGSIELPKDLGEWRWERDPITAWQPVFPGAKEYEFAQYAGAGIDIDVYVNAYSKQEQGAELINQNNRLLARSEVQIGQHKNIVIETLDGQSFEVTSYEATSQSGHKQLFVFWYVVGDRVLTNPSEVKWYELRERLSGYAGSGLIALRAQCAADCANETRETVEFLHAHFQSITSSLMRVLSMDSVWQTGSGTGQ